MVTTLDLWTDFVNTRDQALRDKLVVQYAPLVRYVIERLSVSYPGIMDSDDVFNCGVVGLIQAVDRFDPRQGVKFETYGISRIKGAIIDELRKIDPVSRNTRKMGRQIESAYVELQEELGRPATEAEVAEHLGLELSTLNNLTLELGRTTLSLDAPYDSDDGSDSVSLADVIEDRNSPNPQDTLEKKELAQSLVQVLKQLPEREKLVLSLYYYEELTLKEISKVIDVSESRVCQIHSQAILRLRGLLRVKYWGKTA